MGVPLLTLRPIFADYLWSIGFMIVAQCSSDFVVNLNSWWPSMAVPRIDLDRSNGGINSALIAVGFGGYLG